MRRLIKKTDTPHPQQTSKPQPWLQDDRENLNILTMIKASQAISSEIDFEKLLQKTSSPKPSLRKQAETQNLIEFPQYTRPPVFKGWKVPKILLSGNHQKIAEWRAKKTKLKH